MNFFRRNKNAAVVTVEPSLPTPEPPPPPSPTLSGVPDCPRALAVDPVQGLVAVGSEFGEVHIWGERGAEQRLPAPADAGPHPVLELHFLVNEGRLLVVHAPTLLCLWSLEGHSATLVATASHPMPITVGYNAPRSPYFLFGTERNAIVLAFDVSAAHIRPSTWTRSFRAEMGGAFAGAVCALALRPADPSLTLLIGTAGNPYSGATGMLLVTKLTDASAPPTALGQHPDEEVGLCCASWVDDGALVVVGYDNGDALFWSLRNPAAPTARLQLCAFGPTGVPPAVGAAAAAAAAAEANPAGALGFGGSKAARRAVRSIRPVGGPRDGPHGASARAVLHVMGGTALEAQPDGLVVCRGDGFQERSLLAPPSGGVQVAVPVGDASPEHLFLLSSEGALLRYSLRQLGGAPWRYPDEVTLHTTLAERPRVRLALTPCGGQRTLAQLTVSVPIAQPPALVLPPPPSADVRHGPDPGAPFFAVGRPWPKEADDGSVLGGLAKAANWAAEASQKGAADAEAFTSDGADEGADSARSMKSSLSGWLGEGLTAAAGWVAKQQERQQEAPAIALGRVLFPPPAPATAPAAAPTAPADSAAPSRESAAARMRRHAEEQAAEQAKASSAARERGREEEQARRDRVFEEAKREALLGRAKDAGRSSERGKARAAAAGRAGRATSAAHGAADTMNENMQALHERGEKLGQLGDKSQQLADDASDFADLAKQLRKQQERGFFGLF